MLIKCPNEKCNAEIIPTIYESAIKGGKFECPICKSTWYFANNKIFALDSNPMLSVQKFIFECQDRQDHWMICYTNVDDNICCEFPVHLTNGIVKFLCSLFGIEYDAKWFVVLIGAEKNGNQLTITKRL